MAKTEVPQEVVEVIRKILEQLNKVLDKLPKQAKAAAGILASLIGYGKELKESLNEQELRVAMDQLALIEDAFEGTELIEALLPADLIQAIKALIKGLVYVLRQAGYSYAYPSYKPAYGGYPTYYSTYPKAQGYYQQPAGKAKPHEAAAPVVAPSAVSSAMPTAVPTAIPQPLELLSVKRLVESARLHEAIEGSEGLEWKISLIEAGQSKNRKLYRPEVLKGALPLFEGLSSYADHPTKEELQRGTERSIRDLCGWVTNVDWDEDGGLLGQGSVVGIYHALASGPIAEILREAWQRGKPDLVQFSILGEGRQRVERNESGTLYYNVESIDRLFSLDAVPQGAAGGRVQAMIESTKEEVRELDLLERMDLSELARLRPDLAGALLPASALGGGTAAPIPIQGGTGAAPLTMPSAMSPAEPASDMAALREQIERMQMELALNNRQRLLAERVSNSALPDAIKTRIKEDFNGVIFDEDALDNAIRREQEIWGNILRDKPRVQTVSIRETQRDRYVDAVFGMLEEKDINGVPRFHSIHQAYCTVKGIPFDADKKAIADGLMMEGIGYDPLTRILRESPSIAWTLVFGDAMQRKLIKDYGIPAFDDWRKIVSDITNLPHFKTQRSLRQGYYATLPVVNAGGTYQPLTSPGEEEATYNPAKAGGTEDWTWEQALNDDLGALKKIPKRLALAAKITLYQFVFDMLRLGSVTATSYDGVNLFAAAHANLAVPGVALSSATLTTAKVAMRSQTALGSTATYLAIKPKYLVIPNVLESLGIQLRDSDYEVPGVGVNTSRQIANPHKGTFELIVVDYWTDPDNWYVVADPALVPTIEIGFLGGKEEPDLLTLAANTGSEFSADKIVLKVRQVKGGTPLDHRSMYASEP